MVILSSTFQGISSTKHAVKAPITFNQIAVSGIQNVAR